MLAPRRIVDILALKLYIGNQRADNRIGKIIQINEDNARIQYEYLKSIIEMERKYRPKNVI